MTIPAPPDETLPGSKQESASSPEPKDAAMTDAQKKELIRRIPLNEVLSEEYWAHDPSEASREALEARRERLERYRHETEPDEALIRREEARIAFAEKQLTLRKQCEEIKDEKERELKEKEANDELTRAFFTLLAREQRAQAEEEFRKLSRGGEDARAAIDHVYGITKDKEECRKWEEKKSGGGEKDDQTADNPSQGDSTSDGPISESSSDGGSTRGGGNGGSGGGSKGSGGGGNGSGNGVAAGDAAGDAAGGGGGGRPKTPLETQRASARTLRSALCLSGGGIRSATFNLGIIQGLARHGLLEKFDYLSTVSGGGFIGGWLSGWLHRQADPALRDPDPPDPHGTRTSPVTDVQRVVAQLRRKPTSPLEPEPKPINNLRVYSNFLSPQTGLLSADTWTLIATVLRNLLLTWLVFVPFLLVALLVPRAWMSLVAHWPRGAGLPLGWSFWIGLFAAWVALTYLGTSLAKLAYPDAPTDERCTPHETRFLRVCLLPAVISAASMAVNLWWHGKSYDKYPRFYFVLFAILLFLIPWVVTGLYRKSLSGREGGGRGATKASRRKGQWWRLVMATIVILLVQVIIGIILYVVVTQINPLLAPHTRAYAVLSVPLLLLVLMLDCVLIAGFTSTLTEDEEMEWWARAGAWFFIAIVGWAVIHTLVLFGPELILRLGVNLGEITSGTFWRGDTLKTAGQLVAVVGGFVSLVITLVGGFSSNTTPHGKEGAARGGGGSGLLGVLAGLLGPIALAFLLVLLAISTNYLLKGFGVLLAGADWPGWLVRKLPGLGLMRWLQAGVGSLGSISATEHAALVEGTSLRLLAAAAAVIGFLVLVLGMLINTNKFSLHYMWRNRIIRAYLGASNKKRRPDVFTNFDPNDNIQMHELRRARRQDAGGGGGEEGAVVEPGAAHREETPALPRKLFHVLNIALNLAGGDKLAWQDRKSESFTVSPLHCGSYWLGYRRSRVYGGDKGISLGTAVAISGAFVSPNMGYMMTSPVVRFLMTLFNVRFGWWLGNPGPIGDHTPLPERLTGIIRRRLGRISDHPFESSSPALSVIPIVSEAFGKTDDRSPYVYLSDGGHFENLGLYEMVLRRCRFIVVSDASTDAGYSFDSLAQSIRQIRVDFGIPIEITDMSIIPPSDDMRGKYCAVGTIRYSCVDHDTNNPEQAGLKAEDFDGTLVYIKASMIGDEPRDVVNYGRGSSTFPQEIIVDQWFSEAQFESYRALGSHIIDRLCSVGLNHTNDSNQVTLAQFEDKARRHNQLHFGVFKERASYAALENEFRRMMRRDIPGYSDRVREYFKTLVE